MRFGGILLVTLLLVGSCSDPEPKEPKSSPTSPTPTATAPTMPAQATENTPEGAAAFVKHYIDVFNYASNTGDVEELSRLSSPECEGCQSYIKLYRDTYEAGGYFKDSNWTLGDLDLEYRDDATVVFGRVTSQPGVFLTDSASTPEAGNPEDSNLTFVLDRTPEGWNLGTLELQAE
jgi:hypothetical protein